MNALSKLLPFAALLLGSISMPAAAVVTCVADGDQLRNAVTASENNAVDDEIRLRSGYYLEPNSSHFVVATLTGTQSLSISGGWIGANGSCTSQERDPTATSFIPGAGTSRLFRIELGSMASGTFTLSHLELTGHEFSENTGEAGSCLQVDSLGANVAKVRIERVEFRNCRALSYGAADIEMGGGKLHFLGNLVIVNVSAAGSGVRLIANTGDVYVNNNTITGNQGGAAYVSGLRLQGTSYFYVSNNILWGNDGIADIAVTGNTVLLSNIIGDISGTPNALSGDNYFGNPKFEWGGYFRLSAQSPARNTGANGPYGGAPTVDFYGDARTQESTIDRGAVEFEASLFKNSFD